MIANKRYCSMRLPVISTSSSEAEALPSVGTGVCRSTLAPPADDLGLDVGEGCFASTCSDLVGEGVELGGTDTEVAVGLNGVSVGRGVSVGKGVSVGRNVLVGEGVSVGRGVFVGKGVSVGNGVLVGGGAQI